MRPSPYPDSRHRDHPGPVLSNPPRSWGGQPGPGHAPGAQPGSSTQGPAHRAGEAAPGPRKHFLPGCSEPSGHLITVHTNHRHHKTELQLPTSKPQSDSPAAPPPPSQGPQPQTGAPAQLLRHPASSITGGRASTAQPSQGHQLHRAAGLQGCTSPTDSPLLPGLGAQPSLRLRPSHTWPPVPHQSPTCPELEPLHSPVSTRRPAGTSWRDPLVPLQLSPSRATPVPSN